VTRRFAVLAVLVGMLLAACADGDRSADRDQSGGFYSGVSGGLTR